jgi:RNA polymerase sigma factor FliA
MALKILKSAKRKKAASAATKGKESQSGLKTGKALARKQLEIRDRLINQYLPYASSIAGRIMQMLSSAVDFDDVMSYARLGLLEAAQRFDPSMNVDFKTFAYYRIKGAIYDGLRKSGWIPRALYAKIKFEQATNNYLDQLARSGDSRDADEKTSEIFSTVNSLASIYVISIDASEETMDIEDTSAKNSEQSAQFQQLKEHMKSAIELLPSKERKLIKMYYFQNKTLEEAGETLGLSKSWTSRLHARALEILFKKVHSRIYTQSPAVESVGTEVDFVPAQQGAVS